MVTKYYENRTYIAIGERLRLVREANEMNQGDFAKLANIARVAYNQYENGKKRPSVDNALNLCDVYGLTLDWIYTGDPSGLPLQLVQKLGLLPEKTDHLNYETSAALEHTGMSEPQKTFKK